MDRFHNFLRIMLSIDPHELVAAGAFVDPDTSEIRTEMIECFIASPFETFIRADDRTAAAIWSIIQARSSERAE